MLISGINVKILFSFAVLESMSGCVLGDSFLRFHNSEWFSVSFSFVCSFAGLGAASKFCCSLASKAKRNMRSAQK